MDNKVDIEVEYCGTCGYKEKFDELQKHLLGNYPNIKLTGFEGRRATFEVKVNGELVHSKLCTMAFPDNEDVNSLVFEVMGGKPVRQLKAQPITNCIIV